MSKAIQRFEKECEAEGLAIPSQPRSFIKYQVDKFQETKSMANRPHHPDSKIIKDEEAGMLAAVLKAGYTVTRPALRPGLPPMQLRRFYPTIKKACFQNPTLGAALSKYNVKPGYLLRRMHEVDPDLVWRRVDFKAEQSEKNQAERVKETGVCLQWLARYPPLLSCIFWIDWVTVILCDKNINLKVYMDAHDLNARHVLHIDGLPKNTTIKVHAIAAINAWEGPFYWEAGTGTTDLRRLNNRHPEPYGVRTGGCWVRVGWDTVWGQDAQQQLGGEHGSIHKGAM